MNIREPGSAPGPHHRAGFLGKRWHWAPVLTKGSRQTEDPLDSQESCHFWCFLSLALAQVMKVVWDSDEGWQIKSSCVQPTRPYQVTSFPSAAVLPQPLYSWAQLKQRPCSGFTKCTAKTGVHSVPQMMSLWRGRPLGRKKMSGYYFPSRNSATSWALLSPLKARLSCPEDRLRKKKNVKIYHNKNDGCLVSAQYKAIPPFRTQREISPWPWMNGRFQSVPWLIWRLVKGRSEPSPSASDTAASQRRRDLFLSTLTVHSPWSPWWHCLTPWGTFSQCKGRTILLLYKQIAESSATGGLRGAC